MTFAETPVGIIKHPLGVFKTWTGATKPESMKIAYDELRLLVRPMLYRNSGSEIIYIYGGIATERTALVEKTIESFRKFEFNVARINAREIKPKHIFTLWYKDFIKKECKEGLAYEELDNFFSAYDRVRLGGTKIKSTHDDWGQAD